MGGQAWVGKKAGVSRQAGLGGKQVGGGQAEKQAKMQIICKLSTH